MKRLPSLLVCLVAAALCASSCTALRTRVRWASVGDTPLICCGGVGNYIQIPASPNFQQAALAYIQIVNLPGGCDSFHGNTKAAQIAHSIEDTFRRGEKCPNWCSDDGAGFPSATIGRQLQELKDEAYKNGPSMHSSEGPPCFGHGTP